MQERQEKGRQIRVHYLLEEPEAQAEVSAGTPWVFAVRQLTKEFVGKASGDEQGATVSRT